MGMYDRDWYRDHHKDQRGGPAQAQPLRPPRIRHMLSPWTRFWARAILICLALSVVVALIRFMKS